MAVVQIAHSVVTAHAPTLILPGQIGINEADRKLFCRDPGGNAISVALEQFAARGSVSASASVAFVFPTLYASFRAMKISVWDVQSSVSDASLRLRCSTNAGVSYDSTSNYQWAVGGGWINDSTGASGTDTSILLLEDISSTANDRGSVTLFVPAQSAGYQNIYFGFANRGSNAGTAYGQNAGAGGGIYRNTGVNAVQIFGSSGNVTLKFAMTGVLG